MKGLRELALSCMLFACAANTMATEIAGNLLKLDPLVYFGAESFQLDEVKGLNGGQTDAFLSFSSNAPTTVPSFLGEHAGQALQLNGDAYLDLSGTFLSESSVAPGLVLGFSPVKMTSQVLPPNVCFLLATASRWFWRRVALRYMSRVRAGALSIRRMFQAWTIQPRRCSWSFPAERSRFIGASIKSGTMPYLAV